MKKALLYTCVFLAIQSLVPFLIGTTLTIAGKDFDMHDALPLIICTAASSVVTIALSLGKGVTKLRSVPAVDCAVLVCSGSCRVCHPVRLVAGANARTAQSGGAGV